LPLDDATRGLCWPRLPAPGVSTGQLAPDTSTAVHRIAPAMIHANVTTAAKRIAAAATNHESL
jgi:hypothetical protein